MKHQTVDNTAIRLRPRRCTVGAGTAVPEATQIPDQVALQRSPALTNASDRAYQRHLRTQRGPTTSPSAAQATLNYP
jgi:hypothetical protein